MSNLIPDSYLQKLLRAFQARFITAGSVLFIGAAIVSLLALAPGFILLYTSKPHETDIPKNSEQNKADLVEVATAQLLVQQFSVVVSATSTTEAIAAALGARPAGVRIDQISYTPGNPGALRISGTGSTRDVINSYREVLASGAFFKSVTVPVGDLVGSQGGHFKMTLTGDF